MIKPPEGSLPAVRTGGGEVRVYYRPGPGSEAPFAPREILAFLRRRALLILGVFAVVSALVAAWTVTLPRSYESTASFLVETRRQGAGEALAILDRVGRGQTTETESELLLGRRVVEPVVDGLDLHLAVVEGYDLDPVELFSSVNAGPDAETGRYRIAVEGGAYVVRDGESGATLASAAPGGALSFANMELGVPDEELLAPLLLEVSPFSEAVQATQGRLSAYSSSRQSVILRLGCSGGSPRAAQRLCTEVQESYLNLRMDLQRAEAVAASDFLGDQVARVQSQLEEAENRLRAYQGRTGAIALDAQAGEGVVQAVGLQASRRELAAEREALAALIDQVESGGGGPARYRELASFPTFLQSTDLVSSLMESLVELENRRTDLAVRRTEVDPELVAVDARIADIESQLLRFAEGYRESLSAQIASIDASIGAQGRDLSRLPAQQLETARLTRRVEVLDELFRYLQSRLQEAEVAEAVALPSVSVVDPPSLPFEPSWPNVPLNLALGLFLGATSGVLSGLWREHTDQKVHDGRDVSDWGLPVLSMIPRVPRKALPAASRALAAPGAESLEALQLLHESFRTLTFELEAAGSRVSAAGLRSVALSSAGRGDGKTFCACRLAIQSAMQGQRTLLIDADVRARGVGRWFGLDPEGPGLTDLMGRDRDGLAGLDDRVHAIPAAGGLDLHVLPSGRESRASPRMVTTTLRRILRAASAGYDLVVVDTPPLALMSDAAQVAGLVDGVIVVVRPGVTERPALVRAFEQLSRVGAEVLGIVLNEVAVPRYYGRPVGASS